MKRRGLRVRSLALVLALAVGAAAASCSSKSSDSGKPTTSGGGSGGGAGASPSAEPIQCGSNTCDGVTLVKGIDPLAACCVNSDACGLDSSFLAQYGVAFSDTCQARDQPGVDGHGGADSPPLKVPDKDFTIPALPGCCRTDTKTCGYRLDKLLGLFDVGLGCIDSTPFQDGGAAPSCDPEGAAGAGP